MKGVWRTRVGYAGGDRENPTYGDLGDQTECVQIDFDPTVISYAELVDLALASYDPSSTSSDVQYAYVILAQDDEQLRIARERAQAVATKYGRPVTTRIEPLKRFWLAEDYHQKYYLRSDGSLGAQFKELFAGDEAAFRDSAAAMRVNGYLSGIGTRTQLDQEIGSLGLGEAARERLALLVGATKAGAGCPVP